MTSQTAASLHHDVLQTRPHLQQPAPVHDAHRTSAGQPSSTPTRTEFPSPELEARRGRRRSREDATEGGENGDGSSNEGEGGGDGPRKRRRSRKGLDKKFDCPHELCGKSYSRAEHLYRHQLNHNPKQIYRCEFVGCHRFFVRQDLCARHMERHTAKGSQLQRKDAFLQSVIPAPSQQSASELSQETGQFSPVMPGYPGSEPNLGQHGSPAPRSIYASSPENTLSTISPNSTVAPMGMSLSTATGVVTSGVTRGGSIRPGTSNGASDPSTPGLHRSESGRSLRWEETAAGRDQAAMSMGAPIATYNAGQRHASFGSSDAMYQDPNLPANRVYNMMKLSGQATPRIQSLSLQTPGPSQASAASAYVESRTPTLGLFPDSPRGVYLPQQNVASFSLPPPEYAPPSAPTPISAPHTLSYATVSPGMIGTAAQSNLSDGNAFDPNAMSSTHPVFGEGAFGDEASTRSPYMITDNFTTWLFNSGLAGTDMAGFADSMGGGFQSAPYMTGDLTMSGNYSQPIPPHRPMAVISLLDTRPESVLSESKRQELIDVIVNRFNENDHAPVLRQKEQLLEGDREDDSHVLSLRMMQRYIVSYWDNFHLHLPILHRPSFAAERTPNLLLLAIMTIGATCLDRVHSPELAQSAAQLSHFLAWHLRWAIFSDSAFRPPAKLWIFQALLLLETYEKLYSTRALHERAHIHHATTITLMRRGSSLIGRTPLDSPPSGKDGSAGSGHAANGTSSSSRNAPERWWQRWITSEATRRCAFAAFVLDSIHATMFGHSAVMVAHEMRLPLPCDERSWAANDGAEVGRIEAGLQADGIKPVTFLEGLKATLGEQKVRTNSFGRTILMAGLLSVSYHMHQRDLQVHSLGVSQAVGGREKWRVSLLKAFDVWQHHYDGSFGAGASRSPNASHHAKSLGLDDEGGATTDDRIIFESRTVLHHLAHMAMHVYIVDCQIFAGAVRLLGRSIGPQDFKSASRRMKEWAPRAQARDATFYSLRFLSKVLLPRPGRHGRSGQAISEYNARDDCLLNRPWVLYFAALIVWSYGYALEGPLRSTPTMTILSLPPLTPQEQYEDLCNFLTRVGGVGSPEELRLVTGRNGCIGVLMVLQETFAKTRWELLHEAGRLLGKCIDKLLGKEPV